MATHAVDVALLILRIAVGVIFIAHGSQKVFGWFGGNGLAGVAQMVGGLGLKPAMFWAVLLAFTELLGGLFLVFGLLTRLAALGILISQVVAVATIHGKQGFFLSGGGYEYNVSLMAILLALLIAGPGIYSLDAAWHIPYMSSRYRGI